MRSYDRPPASPSEAIFISGKQARHALRQGEQGFLAWVSSVEETKASYSDFREIIDSSSHSSRDEQKELLTVLREFSDVFPSDLPSKLPPKHTVDHDIDLIPGSSPPVADPGFGSRGGGGGAWSSKTPKLVIATRSRRGPALAPSRGVRGHAPPGNFENWDAQMGNFQLYSTSLSKLVRSLPVSKLGTLYLFLNLERT